VTNLWDVYITSICINELRFQLGGCVELQKNNEVMKEASEYMFLINRLS